MKRSYVILFLLLTTPFLPIGIVAGVAFRSIMAGFLFGRDCVDKYSLEVTSGNWGKNK